jgi:hypothetical protein
VAFSAEVIESPARSRLPVLIERGELIARFLRRSAQFSHRLPPVRPVSDVFLLSVAEIAATLIGLLLVGAFFYVETGLRRLGRAREAATSYLRAGT